MLDLSNNNGSVNFRTVRQRTGHRRVYLKATEGLHFVDKFYKARYVAAKAAGFKVGAYHFGHTYNSPEAEARHFHSVVGKVKPGDLRPCLDFEIDAPSAAWAQRFLKEAERLFGVKPIIYSYPDYLRRAHFKKAPAALWLASFGRNDGKEHTFFIPLPWKRVAAHQYSSNARVPGIAGKVDISRVVSFRAVDVPRLSLKRIRAK